MGMFDYVECEHPLPDGWDMSGDAVGLQTKAFDCDMTTVRIGANGRLTVERYDWETVPKAERPHPNDDGMLGLIGSMRRVNRRWVDLDFHGEFDFGGLEVIGHDEPDERGYRRPHYKSHDYIARFTDGQLVGIRCADAEPVQ